MILDRSQRAWLCYAYFVSFLFLVVLVLVLPGFDLEDVNRWLGRQSGWLNAVGTIIFDIVIFLIGLLAALCAASLFFPKSWGPKAGPGGAIFAAFLAYWMFKVLWLGGV